MKWGSQADTPRPVRDLFEGRPASIVIDIQTSTLVDQAVRAIDHMSGYAERMTKSRVAIDKARECRIPVVLFQAVHRPEHIGSVRSR